MEWQLQHAKARFSELIDRTLSEGPQTVTRRGKAVAVVIPAAEYRRLKTRGKSLKAYLVSGPHGDLEIDRPRDMGRVVDFDVSD
ncbi:MAG: type II toxin-antitoxin system Phd/YefM family antitoxin [Candidatus Binataceae bacterium]